CAVAEDAPGRAIEEGWPPDSASIYALHHVSHATHAARHACSGLLRRLGDDRFGHEDVLGDRGGVLKRRAGDHRWIDDPGFDQVLDLVAVDVESLAFGGLADVVDDD